MKNRYDIIIYFDGLQKPIYKKDLNSDMFAFYLQSIQKIETFESVLIIKYKDGKNV